MNNNVIYNLYVLSAYDFPESAKQWMPNWFTRHKGFEEVKGSRVFKIFEKFGLNDFKHAFKDPSVIEDFKDLITNQLAFVLKSLIRAPDSPEANQLEQVTYKLLQDAMGSAMWTAGKNRVTTQLASEDKRFRIDAGTSIIKAYNVIKIKAAALGITIPAIENSEQFKNYSKRGDLYVVFSTKPEDVAAMASRSDWETCQTIEVNSGQGMMNACLVGSTLSKFIGVIYITAGDMFQNRGEKMVARSLVRFVIDTKNNKPAIVLDKMYPSYYPKFAEAIKSALQQRTSVPVIDIKTLSKEDSSRFLIPEENMPGVKRHERSYLDEPEFFGTKKVEKNTNVPVDNPVVFFRKYITNTSEKISENVLLWIIKNINLDENEFKMYEYDLKKSCQTLTKQIISSLVKEIALTVANHYKNRKAPFSESFLTRYIDRQLINPKSKEIIDEILKFQKSLTNTGLLDRIVGRRAPRAEMTDYIYNQFVALTK